MALKVCAPGGTSATVNQMGDDDGSYTSYNGNKYGQTAGVHAGKIDQPITMCVVDAHGVVREPDSQEGGRERMQYVRNRYYDPSTGRFTQQDPIGLAGGMNLYGFAGGDPVNFSDPFGLCPVCIVVEAGFSLFDAIDLGVTAYKHSKGTVSDEALAVTGAGFIAGLTSVGGGYGRAARRGLSKTAKGVPVPQVDATGKIHGDLPSHVPDNWTADDVGDVADNLRTSIGTRQAEARRLGEDGPHRRRINEEQRLLRQVEKRQQDQRPRN